MPMTIEKQREVHVPDGCRLVRVIDHLDERGPIVKVYKRINTPEQEAKVRATIQRVLNEEYTKACAREAALAAGYNAGAEPASRPRTVEKWTSWEETI